MFVALYIVEREHRAVSRGQLGDGFVERDAIYDRHGTRVFSAFDYLHRRLTILGRLFQAHAALAKVHQHLVDGQAVQPGRKGRLAAKASDLAKELDEDFLRQVLGFRDIRRHP